MKPPSLHNSFMHLITLAIGLLSVVLASETIRDNVPSNIFENVNFGYKGRQLVGVVEVQDGLVILLTSLQISLTDAKIMPFESSIGIESGVELIADGAGQLVKFIGVGVEFIEKLKSSVKTPEKLSSSNPINRSNDVAKEDVIIEVDNDNHSDMMNDIAKEDDIIIIDHDDHNNLIKDINEKNKARQDECTNVIEPKLNDLENRINLLLKESNAKSSSENAVEQQQEKDLDEQQELLHHKIKTIPRTPKDSVLFNAITPMSIDMQINNNHSNHMDNDSNSSTELVEESSLKLVNPTKDHVDDPQNLPDKPNEATILHKMHFEKKLNVPKKRNKNVQTRKSSEKTFLDIQENSEYELLEEVRNSVMRGGGHINIYTKFGREDNAIKFFSDEFVKHLAGVPILDTRKNLLLSTIKSKKNSRGTIDFTIRKGILSEYDFLDGNVRTVGAPSSVMCQAFALDYDKLFLNMSKLHERAISAPIVAIFREKILKSSLVKHRKEFSNNHGTGYLAKKLVKANNLLRVLEQEYNVFMVKDARIFNMPYLDRGRYEIPSERLGKSASFTIVPQIDMEGLALIDWEYHKEDLAMYMTLFYEAVYLAAIKLKSGTVLLNSVLLNATTEQYTVMIDAILRVHLRLGRYLEARKVILGLGDEVKFNEKDLEPLVNRLAKDDASLFIAGRKTATAIKPTKPSPWNKKFAPNKTAQKEVGRLIEQNPIVLGMLINKTKGSVAMYQENYSLYLLSNYFASEYEAQLIASLAPSIVEITTTTNQDKPKEIRVPNSALLLNQFWACGGDGLLNTQAMHGNDDSDSSSDHSSSYSDSGSSSSSSSGN